MVAFPVARARTRAARGFTTYFSRDADFGDAAMITSPLVVELGYKEEALSKYMCAGQVLGAVADVN